MKAKIGKLVILLLTILALVLIFNRPQKDNPLNQDYLQALVVGLETYRTDFFDFGEFHCTKNNIYTSDPFWKNKKTIFTDKNLKDNIRNVLLSPDNKKAIVHFTDPTCGGKDSAYSYNKLLHLDTREMVDFSTTENGLADLKWAPDSNRLAYLYKGSLHLVSIDPFKDGNVINNLFDPSVEDIYLRREVLWVSDTQLYAKTNHTTVEKINLQDTTVTQVIDVKKYNLQISSLASLNEDPLRSFISLYTPGTQPQDKVRFYDLQKKDIVAIMPLQVSSSQNHDCVRNTKWSTSGKYLYLLISNGGCFDYDEFYSEKNHVYRFTREIGKTEKLFSFAVSANPESVHRSQLLYATDNEVTIDSPIRFKNQTEESERRIWKYLVDTKELNQLQVNPNFIDEIQNLIPVSASLFN